MLAVTATDLPRLMTCNGSRLMGGFIPPVSDRDDDTVKQEGIAADWLVQQVFYGKFTPEELVDRKAPNGVFITADMVEHLETYLTAIMRPARGTTKIEVDTSHAGGNWSVGGRADGLTYCGETQHLDVGDLKFGYGIVEPEENWTLISHVIGFIVQNPHLPVRSASLTIYQPRPHHPLGRVRSWPMTPEMINERWAMIDRTLTSPTDVLNTSEHCKGCPAMTMCPAANKAKFNAIDASCRAFTDNLSNDNLSFQLDHVKRAKKVLEQLEKAYDELAKHRMREGQIVKNYALDNDLTNRQWCDHATVEIVTIMTGKDLTKKQLITPNQAEKAGASKEFVAAFTERHNKGVKLVRMDANAKASKIFNQPKGN